MFFFEKRTKKLFYRSQRKNPHSAPKEIKVFCFFSSEKKNFLS